MAAPLRPSSHGPRPDSRADGKKRAVCCRSGHAGQWSNGMTAKASYQRGLVTRTAQQFGNAQNRGAAATVLLQTRPESQSPRLWTGRAGCPRFLMGCWRRPPSGGVSPGRPLRNTQGPIPRDLSAKGGAVVDFLHHKQPPGAMGPCVRRGRPPNNPLLHLPQRSTGSHLIAFAQQREARDHTIYRLR